MIEAAKREIALLGITDVQEKRDNHEDFILVDCREKDEYQLGHIPNALFIPRGVLEMTIERQAPDRDKPIVVYCAGGGRSAMAAFALKKMGYKDVASMEGGFEAWKRSSLPVEK